MLPLGNGSGAGFGGGGTSFAPGRKNRPRSALEKSYSSLISSVMESDFRDSVVSLAIGQRIEAILHDPVQT
jgi:hypothetical protein